MAVYRPVRRAQARRDHPAHGLGRVAGLRALQLLAVMLLAAAARPLAAALPPPVAWPIRVLANGHGAAVYDHGGGRLRDWWLRPYRAAGPLSPTVDVLYDAYFGLRASGATAPAGQWAPQMPLVYDGPQSQAWQAADGASDAVFGYMASSGVVQEHRVAPHLSGLRLTTRAFAPQTCPGRCLVLLATLRNNGQQAQAVELPLLVNIHAGTGEPEAGASAERLQAGVRTLVETGLQSGHVVTVRSIDGQPNAAPPLAGVTATPIVGALYGWLLGQDKLDPNATLSEGDDRVGGLLWSLTVPPNGEVTVGAVLGYASLWGDGAGLDAAALDAWLAGRSATQVLADELAWWQQWHSLDKLPPTLTAPQRLAAERALTTLRMAACRQANLGAGGQNTTPHGQIVASLPPGQWNITWPRDQAYAAVALAASGHTSEARDALEFVLRGQAGQFKAEVGAPYRVSVTRYWGGGLEESDFNAYGPNIELDGFGLVLWQAQRYVDAADDAQALAGWWPILRDEVADALLQAIDQTGLIQADSSIWEVHWNGQQKHFAYTSLLAVRGLCGAARLATRMGDGERAAAYRQGARTIHAAWNQLLPSPQGYLRGNLEEPAGKDLDLAAVEAFLDGQAAPWGPLAQASWQAWSQGLRAGGGPGFIRNDDGGAYDSQEWLFIDLRVLRWLDRAVAAGAPLQADRDALRARVETIVTAGGGLWPELIATVPAEAGQFSGAAPMTGFGAGAALLAWLDAGQDDELQGCLGDTLAPTAADADAGPANGADAGRRGDADAGGVAGSGAEDATRSGGAVLDIPSPPAPGSRVGSGGCMSVQPPQTGCAVGCILAAAMAACAWQRRRHGRIRNPR